MTDRAIIGMMNMTTIPEIYPTMITTTGLTKRCAEKDAVRGLSFTVGKGEIVGFLGPNGAGKSTTVKMLTGMILPTSGSATVAGFDIIREPIEAKKRFGYVPESGALFETLTGGEYLHFIADLHHLDRDVAARRADEFLDLFGILAQKVQRSWRATRVSSASRPVGSDPRCRCCPYRWAIPEPSTARSRRP